MIQALLEIYQLKKRLIIFTGILLLLNIILFSFISGYLSPAINKARSKRDELRRQVTAAGQGDVNTLYKRGQADLETIKGKIPVKRQFPRVLGDIIEAAASSGVTTGNVTYKPQALKDENLLSYTVNMNVGGTYAAVKSFLADLQKNDELIVVDGVGLANQDPYEEYVSMDVKLTIYLREQV